MKAIVNRRHDIIQLIVDRPQIDLSVRDDSGATVFSLLVNNLNTGHIFDKCEVDLLNKVLALHDRAVIYDSKEIKQGHFVAYKSCLNLRQNQSMVRDVDLNDSNGKTVGVVFEDKAIRQPEHLTRSLHILIFLVRLRAR